MVPDADADAVKNRHEEEKRVKCMVHLYRTGTMDLPRRALGPVRARRAPHGPDGRLGDHLTRLDRGHTDWQPMRSAVSVDDFVGKLVQEHQECVQGKFNSPIYDARLCLPVSDRWAHGVEEEGESNDENVR